MSAEEATAKADALIAQYRATAPRARRGGVRVPVRAGTGLDARMLLIAAIAIAFVAGLCWTTHRAVSAVLALLLVPIAMRLGRVLAASRDDDRGIAR